MKKYLKAYYYIKHLLCWFINIITSLSAIAQCPTVDFLVPSSACLGEDIKVENLSSETLNFEWDFCSGDLQVDPTARSIQSNSSLRGLYGLELVNDNGIWLLFATDRDNNSLLRFTFGEGLNNSPTAITNLGDLGGLLIQPRAIKLYKIQDRWQGLILSVGNESLINIDFSEGLSNIPRGNVLLSGVGDPNSAMNLVREGNSLLAFVTYYSTSKIDIISLESTEESTNVEKTMSFSVPVSTNIRDIDLIKDCNDWYGIIVARRGRTVQKLRFGSNLFSAPTFENVPDNKNVRPMAGRYIYENGEYYVVTLNENGDFVKLNFGTDINNSLISATNFGNFNILNSTRSIETVWDNGNWYTFTANAVTNELFRIDFSKNCDVSKGGSKLYEPNSISYNESGTFTVTLTGYNDVGGFSSLSKNISITNSQAPRLAIEESESLCSNSVKTFLAINSDELTITSYQWKFGDNSPTASGQEVTHQYTNPGTYKVTLEVQSENGCGNRLTKEITIYEPPAPGFTAPSGQICTNGAVNFANTTDTKGADSLITYRWLVDGELVSEEANPAITFAEGDSKTVRLEARIPGCTEVIEQTVNVQQGPTVGFVVPQVCEGAPVAFENLTSGEDITGYQWDFGDGGTFSSATAESPTYAFEAAGTYEVALSVSNGAGCLNTYRQEVVVYQQPSVGFLSEVACVGTPTQFTDTTTAGANANIIAWQWDFGDGSTAVVKNPAHVYQQPGTYTVRLTAQSTAGCEASTEQTITVESPVAADFLIDRTCPTEEAPYLVQLTDVSTASKGEEVTQWFWTIEGQTFTTPNVTYAFRGPGRYEVSLTAFASSACNATVTKTIQIDTLPTVAFTYENACVGSPLAFESEVSMTGVDTSGGDTSGETISGYIWSFGDVGTALEANPAFVFEEAGTYDVRLTVQTESGCTFTTSQPVTIGEAPVAEFTASATFGGAPLTVNFTHSADASTQYRWNFGGQGTSVEPNPTFTFTELGTYPVTLTATNAVGCIDTFSQTITVVEPAQDIQLTDIEVLDGPNGSQQLVLTLQNAGTLLVPGLSITVDLGDAASLQALVDEPLLPGQTLRYPLSFQLPVPVPNQSNALRYVCASVMVRDADFEETDLDNNRACVSLNQQLSVEAPFPNPATDEVQLSLILPQASPVALRMMNAQGQVLRQQTVAETQSGLNTFLIPVRGLPVGSYILQVMYRGEQQRFRVAVGL